MLDQHDRHAALAQFEDAVAQLADLAGACSIVELPTRGKPSKYVAGFANFEAVTRYNRSTFYATAVLELADAIRAAREREVTASSATPPLLTW